MKSPSDVQSEPAALENRLSQPVCVGSEPRPCATSMLVILPPAMSTRWKRGCEEACEKSATATTSICDTRAPARCRPARAAAMIGDVPPGAPGLGALAGWVTLRVRVWAPRLAGPSAHAPIVAETCRRRRRERDDDC